MKKEEQGGEGRMGQVALVSRIGGRRSRNGDDERNRAIGRRDRTILYRYGNPSWSFRFGSQNIGSPRFGYGIIRYRTVIGKMDDAYMPQLGMIVGLSVIYLCNICTAIQVLV